MKKLLLGLLFVSFSAFADFNGSFGGPGSIASQGMNQNCEEIRFSFVQKSDSLIMNGKVQCGEDSLEYDESVFSIKNNHLYANNLDVGTIGENFIHIKVTETDENDETVQLIMNFDKKDGVIAFEQIEKTKTYTISIKANLK
jgi:hypothetical protein